MSALVQRASFKPQGLFFLLVIALMSMVASVPALADVHKSGSWIQKQKSIQGGWEVHKANGKTIIRMQENFQAVSGPDLKVFLSKTHISNVTGQNATEGSVLLSPLKSTNGVQEYVLPAGVNIADFKSVLVHCLSFSVLWGGADISS